MELANTSVLKAGAQTKKAHKTVLECDPVCSRRVLQLSWLCTYRHYILKGSLTDVYTIYGQWNIYPVIQFQSPEKPAFRSASSCVTCVCVLRTLALHLHKQQMAS